jgi:hypothetical protein
MLAKQLQAPHKHAKAKEGAASIADVAWSCKRATACFEICSTLQALTPAASKQQMLQRLKPSATPGETKASSAMLTDPQLKPQKSRFEQVVHE